MTFSKTLQWLSAAVFIATTTSCDKFLAGKPKKQEFIEVQRDNLRCLKNLSVQVKSYLNAQATSADIDATFACLDTTMAEFQKRAQGTQDANAFSEDDLFQIFKTFLSTAEVSREATSDLLKLKVGLVGGSHKNLTKTEINQLRELLAVLKPELHLLRPFAPLFQFNKNEKVHSKEVISAGFNQLNLTLKRLLAASQLTRTRYYFEDFKSLINNLQLLAGDSKKRIELAADVKNLLTGPEPLQSNADFESLIDSFVEILKLASLQAENYVVFELKTSAALDETLDYFQSWIHLLENSLQFKKRGFLIAGAIDSLILNSVKAKLLPPDMTAETLIGFYRILLVRVLDKGTKGDVLNFTGIQKIHFQNFRRELNAFRLYSLFLKQLDFTKVSAIDDSARLEISAVQNQLREFNFSQALSNHDVQHRSEIDPVEQSKIVRIVDELKLEFLSARPVVYRFDKMVIAANQEAVKQSWPDLTKAVFVKFLARGLMLGWGNVNGSRQIETATLNEANLVTWYEEFKAFGIETKSFDPRSVNSGARSFKEANLFSYSADGNETMTLLETIQYLNILSSGGNTTLAEIKKGFAAANCNMSEMDVFKLPWNNEACAFNDFKVNYKYYLNNLPYLVGFLSRLDDQALFEFYSQAMDVARINHAKKGKLETADIRTFTILLYYIEAMYAQFDTDRNWTFSAQEIRNSYPRFQNFATNFAQKTAADQIAMFNSPLVKELGYGCYSQQDLIRESFIFLVYKGVTPGLRDLNIAPCFGNRALIPFTGEVDRKTIINTFKILKAVLGS